LKAHPVKFIVAIIDGLWYHFIATGGKVMKYIPLVIILAILSTILIGCNLLFPFEDEEVPFYYMTQHDTFYLKHRSGGHIIVMSRGEKGEKLTEEQARALVDDTDFRMELDDLPLSPIGGKDVSEMKDDSGYHVVQHFDLPELGKGSYLLYGKTIFGDHGGNRTDSVNLVIR
jgi:hypothetical protein